MLYLVLKVLHVFSVVLFLGNIVTGIFWKAQGDRGNLHSRAHAVAGIIRSDRVFTLPGVLLIIATGIALVLVGGLSFLTPWILWSLILFGVSGVVFRFQLEPLQKKLSASVQAGLAGQWNESEYRALSKRWQFWGWIATGAPLVALILMVLKPV
ncbi:MAG TPA: DUF2269 family protein [Steroidobacteraceae bacterium]